MAPSGRCAGQRGGVRGLRVLLTSLLVLTCGPRAAAGKPHCKTLKAGWRQGKDSATGKLYYYTDDGKSTWDVPLDTEGTYDEETEWRCFYDWELNYNAMGGGADGNINSAMSVEGLRLFLRAANVTLTRKLHIVDIACGTGEMVIWLARECPMCTIEGMDYSAKRVERAVEALKAEPMEMQQRVQFVVADVYPYVKLGWSADVIFTVEILEHLKEPDLLVKDLRERLRPGGVWLGSAPLEEHTHAQHLTAFGLELDKFVARFNVTHHPIARGMRFDRQIAYSWRQHGGSETEDSRDHAVPERDAEPGVNEEL